MTDQPAPAAEPFPPNGGHTNPCAYAAGIGPDCTCAPEPQPLTPEVVSAILRNPDDPRYPSKITVFCDHCGTEATHDYMVDDQMTRGERLGVARAHLVANEGWESTPDGGDFCPEHAAPVTV